MLGREPGKGTGGAEVWRTAKDRARDERRKAIGVAVAKAHQLEVAVETGPSDDPYVATAGCKEPHVARFRDVALHGVWPAEKLARAAAPERASSIRARASIAEPECTV